MRAALVAGAVLLLAGCGSRVAAPARTPVASPQPALSARPSPEFASRTPSPSTSPQPGPLRSRLVARTEIPISALQGHGPWCRLRPAWRCIDSATARRWWPADQFPAAPPGATHTYLVYGRGGARLDLPPSTDRYSGLVLVLHPPGVTPHEHRREGLVKQGAVTVQVRMTDRYGDGQVTPSAREVTIDGKRAYLVRAKSAEDGFPTRMVVWTERRGSTWFVWTSVDSQSFRSDEELVATLNRIRRP